MHITKLEIVSDILMIVGILSIIPILFFIYAKDTTWGSIIPSVICMGIAKIIDYINKFRNNYG